MIKEIKYNGYTANPSDYECVDGDLALTMGLVQENGAMKPILPPAVGFKIPLGYKIFIHKTGDFTNYIRYKESPSEIYWVANSFENSFDSSRLIISNIGTIKDIAAVGYILIVSSDNGLHYIRYNAQKGNYLYLGNRIPHLDLDFALKLNFEFRKYTNLTLPLKRIDEDGITTTDEWQPLTTKTYYYSDNVANGGRLVDNGNGQLTLDTSVEVLDPNNTIVLKANTDYKMTFSLSHNGYDLQAHYFVLYGRKVGATTDEVLFNSSFSHDSQTFHAQEDYTNLFYMVLGPNTGGDTYFVGTFSIFKGIEHNAIDSSKLQYIVDYTSDNYTTVTAQINKFINERATQKSRFIYPFFLRYAIKLFDGSYSYVSQPILLIPNSDYAPAVYYYGYNDKKTLTISAFLADIQYRLNSPIDDSWKDIISGIDIFVSQPIWLYDQGKNYDATEYLFNFSLNTASRGIGSPFFDDLCINPDWGYFTAPLGDYLSTYATSYHNNFGYIQVAPRSQDDLLNDIRSVGNFYKIKSIKLSELVNGNSFTDVQLDNGMLAALSTKETLNDNIVNYPDFVNAYLKEYNSRIHICHSGATLPDIVYPGKCSGFMSKYKDCQLTAYIKLKTNEGEKLVKRVFTPGESLFFLGSGWFYYPDPRAYSLVLVQSISGIPSYLKEINLTAHDFLNGAYWCGESMLSEIEITTPITSDPLKDASVKNTILKLSDVFVSESNNPFAFSHSSVVSIGAKEVFALETSAKALSQGQFGQFPLYAFTSEGIWALETNSIGSYSSRQPLSRDIIISTDSITQIDSAILFASDRGIMHISGSQVDCISEFLNTETVFSIDQLPKYDKLINIFNNNADERQQITLEKIKLLPFRQFLWGCRMIYDYINQRIIAYNPAVRYSYIYSLKSKTWGMMNSNIIDSVNSYPNAIAITHDGELVDFSITTDKSITALIITRPFKIDSPDTFKTINTIIQRGMFRSSHVQQVLYGSNDLFNWHPVWSSVDKIMRGFSGTPYKTYRLALICKFDKDESIYGCSVAYEPRMTNQIR